MTDNHRRRFAVAAGTLALAISLSSCTGSPAASPPSPSQTKPADVPTATTTGSPATPQDPTSKLVRIGFVAGGPEGPWRNANVQSIQETLTQEAGFDLKYAPAASLDQKAQIDALTAFVDEGVDLILLSATEETGWEASLAHAEAADIPVILIDREISPDDPFAYAARVAPDNFTVAWSISQWLVGNHPEGGKYIMLEGPADLSLVHDRRSGFQMTVGLELDEWEEVGAQNANWKFDEGKSVTKAFLKSHPDIRFIFAQNDEMGLGASEAVTEAGKVVGKDILIATIGGSRAALEALAAGKLSFVAEYNPLFGDQLLNAVTMVLADEGWPRDFEVPSATFDSPKAAKAALPDRTF